MDHPQILRQLELIQELDHIRDSYGENDDPAAMFVAITVWLTQYFEASACGIILVGDMDDGLECIAYTGMEADRVIELGQRALMLDNWSLLNSTAPPNTLATSIILYGQRLGAIVLIRPERPFDETDQALLAVAESQVDSAVIQARTVWKYRQRNTELEVIYRIDRIRDQERDFDTLLQKVLHELCKVISSEVGYIMLYTDREETPLELRSSTNESVLHQPDYMAVIHQFSRQALDSGQLIYDNHIDTGDIHSMIAIPLILHERIIGVFGAVNSSHPRRFRLEDRRLLRAITSQVDTAIFERLEQRRMRSLLSRSVDPKVLDYMMRHANPTHVLAGERVVLSVLFADLRGSTQWAEQIEPEALVAALNLFLGRMTDVIFQHGGTLDKFVGDQVIGLFGSPLPMNDHAGHAAAAALDMQAAHRALAAELATRGHTLPGMGIGISSGEAITGEIGPPIQTDFTAVGRVMNLGARLCAAAGPAQIIISQATFDLVQSHAQATALQPLQLKGIRQPVPVYELLTLKED